MLREQGYSQWNCLMCIPLWFTQLEYGVPIWHAGLTVSDDQRIERIQKRCCRIICNNMTYNEALSFLNTKTLEERRIEICKTFFVNMQDKSHKLNNLICKIKVTN